MTAEGSSTAAGTELGTSGGYTAGGNAVMMGNAAAYASGHRQAQNSSAVSIVGLRIAGQVAPDEEACEPVSQLNKVIFGELEIGLLAQ